MLNKIRSFSFCRNFKFTAIIAAIFVCVGLIGLILLPFGVQLFNFDIDFVGGTTMQFDLHTPVNASVTSDVAAIVQDVSGKPASSVTKAGDSGSQVVIKCLELDSETRDAIFQAVAEKYGLQDTDNLKSDYVSASVGSDLRDKAIKASLIAVALILLYITISTVRAFDALSDATGDYIELAAAADDLMDASDYLTEEVQRYTVIGDRTHLENYFRENYKQRIRMSDIAEEMGISSYYLCHIFQKYKGMSPSKCLSEIRIARAMKLLEETDMPVGKISEECGYPNALNFSKLFSRMNGCSPSNYRKMQRAAPVNARRNE